MALGWFIREAHVNRPTFEAFSASARSAIAEIEGLDEQKVCAEFDRQGASFNFYSDGGLDSLAMLGIALYIEHELSVQIKIELISRREKPMTLENLYGAIQSDSSASA